MNLNKTEQLKYIKNTFHQYFDLTLNKDVSNITDFVNLVIPFEKLYDLEGQSSSHNITIDDEYDTTSILSKYKNTTIPKEKRAICTHVQDGDTITVNIIDDKDNIIQEGVWIRLVGVDTPEVSQAGYDESKRFLQKICYSEEYYRQVIVLENDPSEYINTKKIFLNIDDKKTEDKYGRKLCVLISENKNINEILLKEGLAQVMYIPPSEFNPYDWRDVDTQYDTKSDDFSLLSNFFSPMLTNIVFTPTNDLETIYDYEVYQGVFFIKIKPFSKNIRMHILPKYYDCSTTVLFFKDSMNDKKLVTKTSEYRVCEEQEINAYFQENGLDRNRNEISDTVWNLSDWGDEMETETFVEFSYDISKDAQQYENIEICAGYRYNNTSPYYAIHYMGIKDHTNKFKEDRTTMIDVNMDEITSNQYTGAITQTYFDPNHETIYIHHDISSEYTGRNDFNTVDHITEITKLHHKKIKYLNDMIYSEEDDTCYGVGEWDEPLNDL